VFDSIIFSVFQVTVLFRFSCSGFGDRDSQFHQYYPSQYFVSSISFINNMVSCSPVKFLSGRETETLEYPVYIQFTSLSSITVRETVTLKFLFNKRQCVALGTVSFSPVFGYLGNQTGVTVQQFQF